MKSTRTRALTVRGTNPGTHTVTLRAVRTLLSRIWNQAAPEQGLAYDFTDLTDAKITWRRNLFKESEFRNGINDTDLRAGVTWVAGGVPGFIGSIAFAAGSDAYAYKQVAFVAGRTYTMSVFVKMDDASAPALGTADSGNVGSDFSLVIRGNAISPAACTSTHVGNNVYRVSYALAGGAAQAAGNCGIVKYATNSAKTFKVSGFQIESGLLTNYQPITDGGTGDFLREFPTHSLYQDHVGNLPVTNIEQPVGLVLDMRQLGFRGVEINPDVGMNTPASWSYGGTAPLWSVSGGVGACTATSTGNRWITSSATLTVGKWYEVYADVVVTSGGTLPDISSSYSVFATTSGRKHWILQATTASLQFLAQPGFVGSIDNVSFREVPGNHALQPTTGDRPTISGRFNWLTNSEVMSDATYWSKSGNGTGTAPVVTDNFAAAPDGTITATRIQMALNGGTTTADQSRILQPIATVGTTTYYQQHFWAKTNDGSTKQVSLRDDFSGTVNAMLTITPTWQQFVGPVNNFANNTTVNAISLWLRGAIGTSDSVDMLVWHPQVERSTVVFGKPGPYQRVGAAPTDYDPIGFTKGARFNGTNSWLFAPGVDLTGSDKLLATACTRRESDANTAVVMEHGPDSSANAGTFGLFAPGSGGAANLGLRAQGSSATIGFSSAIPTPAPGYTLTSAVIDFANSVLVLRRDGAYQANNTTALGAGNFTNRTFYVGRRGGTGLAYNGMLYRMAVRGGLADNFIGLAERWASDAAKAFL